jgi:predicted transcriptional regulator
MSTTTIRIEDDLKMRVAALAQRAGKTSHAFIVEALEQKVEQLEVDEEFHRLADERWTKILATGKTIPWEEAQSYLEARAVGQHPRRPVGRKPKQQGL